MGNRLFQQAREDVRAAKENPVPTAISRAKNALTSAYANATEAEQRQLRDLQSEIEQLK